MLVGGAHISFYRQWAAAGHEQQDPDGSTTFGVGNEHMVLTPAEEATASSVAYSYFQELDTPANKAFLEKLHDKHAERRPISAASSRC